MFWDSTIAPPLTDKFTMSENVQTVALHSVFSGEIASRDVRDGRRMIFVRVTGENGPILPLGFTIADAHRLAGLLQVASDAEQVARLDSGIDQFFTEAIP
jgi:hypothetical protein